MKKNILVYTYNLEMGGIERSLIGLLNSFDFDNYNVDLFMFKHEGVLMQDIPNGVNLLPTEPLTENVGIPILQVLKNGSFKIGFIRLAAKLKYFIQVKVLKKNYTPEYIGQLTYPKYAKIMAPIKKEYDLAVSFYWTHDFVIQNVKAKVKIGWIHTDYERIFTHRKLEMKMWEQVDYIAGVSTECVNQFLKVYPKYKNKMMVMENVLSPSYVRNRAKIFDAYDEYSKYTKGENPIVFCSVGRYVEAKNFDNVPQICKMIREKGHNVFWFLIGYGSDEQLIFSKIKEYNMQDYVIMLGFKENPYPYMQGADYYLQPSRFEGKSVTVREAQMLCKPVIIANYATAKSQVKDKKDGFIVQQENTLCANGISAVLSDEQSKNDVIKTCENYNFGNENEVEKLYALI